MLLSFVNRYDKAFGDYYGTSLGNLSGFNAYISFVLIFPINLILLLFQI